MKPVKIVDGMSVVERFARSCRNTAILASEWKRDPSPENLKELEGAIAVFESARKEYKSLTPAGIQKSIEEEQKNWIREGSGPKDN